jgi:transcriptional regulator GlxA family with amidase domain
MSLFSVSELTLNVVILLLPQSSLMALAATLDTMRAANRISRRSLFQWKVTTLDGEAAKLTCAQEIYPDEDFYQNTGNELLICIAGFDNQRHLPNQQLAAFKRRAKQFKYIGGVDSGSWILARAGFLQARRATIHWEDLEDFTNANPNIEVRPDRYVIDGKYFTTGGAAPTIDLFLYLIRSRYGHTLALEVASIFIYDGGLQGQTPQPFVSLGPLQTQQPKISSAVRIMENHLDSPVDTQFIAEQLNMSSRNLELLFRKKLDTSPQRYYKRLRLQAAKRMVLNSSHSMQEVAVRCGFNSLSAFSREFKRFYKSSPLKYRMHTSADD